MKGSKTKRQLLAFGIPEFEKGQTFDAWPLHLTVVPWFNVSALEAWRLDRKLRDLTERTRPLHLKIGDAAMMGARHNVPVRLVDDSKRVDQFHADVLTQVHQAGIEIEDMTHVSYRYRPHITTRHGEELQDEYTVTQLALVSLADHGQKHVDEVFELHG